MSTSASQLGILSRTPTSPARDRQPAGHRPSHIGCTHSFRTNGGYTNTAIERGRYQLARPSQARSCFHLRHASSCLADVGRVVGE
jgi:hypothetical protein